MAHITIRKFSGQSRYTTENGAAWEGTEDAVFLRTVKNNFSCGLERRSSSRSLNTFHYEKVEP